jgi:hypothetical protein
VDEGNLVNCINEAVILDTSMLEGRKLGSGRTAEKEENESMQGLDEMHSEHQPKTKEPECQGQPIAPIPRWAD